MAGTCTQTQFKVSGAKPPTDLTTTGIDLSGYNCPIEKGVNYQGPKNT